MSVPQLPGFRYVKPLGRGGYGEVFSAYQDQFDRWVAVKVLGFTLTDPRLQRQFVRECRLAGRLSAHPNIVTVYDSGIVAGGQPYITMELFPDGSITDALRLQGAFSVPDAVRIGIALAGALETAHGAGVVHRDVKPANVLLATYGQPALTDFGLSVVAEQHEASMGIDALTPYHAAPEVLERTAASPVADVYSLASTVYAMLAGRAPHQVNGDSPDSIAALLLRVLQQDVPPLERPDAPPSLHAALGRALARDAATRTPTARAFAAELQAVQRELGLEVTEPVVMDVPDAIDVPGAMDVAAPGPDRTGLVIPPPPPAPPLPAPPPPPGTDRPALPSRTPGTSGNGRGTTEPTEPSLDQLAALERALVGQPPPKEPLLPAERTRRPPPAPLRRRPDTPAPPRPPTPAAPAAPPPATSTPPPPAPPPALPSPPPAPPVPLPTAPATPPGPPPPPAGPPTVPPPGHAPSAPPPAPAPSAPPEAPQAPMPAPAAPAASMPPAPPAAPPAPLPGPAAPMPGGAVPDSPEGTPEPFAAGPAPVEPVELSVAPPGWPSETDGGSRPVPSDPPQPEPAATEPDGGLPSWVTEAMGGGHPKVAAPPAEPTGPAPDPVGDMTVEREVVRGYLPPPAPAPAPPAAPVDPPRRGRALPVLVGLLVVVALAMGAFVLFGQGDDGGGGGGDPEEPDTPSTTLAVPSGLTAVESPAGVQLEWDGDDAEIYAVLMMSEITEPQVVPAETGSSLLVPATRLSPDDAYCFAVAYLSGLEAATSPEDAFGPPACIRGASEDTVRPG